MESIENLLKLQLLNRMIEDDPDNKELEELRRLFIQKLQDELKTKW